MRAVATSWALLWAVLLLPAVASAQGLLIDEREGEQFRLPRAHIWPGPRPPRPQPPPQSYRIQELGIDVNLQDQVAKVQVSQSFVNTGSRQMEVCFVFPLPYDGAIDRMTFMVDGKEYEAKLLSAAEARRIYEGYVRRNRDPALMEWIGTGMFKTSVFPVPPGAKRTVSLRYSQLCRKQNGLTELLFPLSTAKYTSQPVDQVNINVTVQSQAKIKNVYSPTHAVKIQRPTDQLAKISYSSSHEIPTSDFRLMYDVGDAQVGASLLSYRPQRGEDGYFLLLVSPEIKRKGAAVNKNVIFVVDRSGSMTGTKIEQAKGALRFVLNNLSEGDLFNIIAYDSSVESFQPELQRYNDATRKQALGFVEGIFAGGSTNIDGALQTALGQLQDDSRPNYIVFLTDGLPTAGEKNESRIVDNARQRNATARARVFSFGVGYDVNSRLLDKLSRDCFGQSQYVRPNEDIEEHVSKLYNRIGAPVMTDVQITVDLEDLPAERGAAVNRVYPRDAYDLFAGDQLVLVGRYKQGGTARVTVRGRVGADEQQFSFPGTFVGKSNDETNGFVEKLWALRRVGEIIDEIDLHGKNQELINELVALSTKHGIITPYTSFLADENANVRDLAGLRRQAGVQLDALQEAGGRGGFAQRQLKAEYQRAAQATPAPGGAGGGGFGVVYRDVEQDKDVVVQTVQNVGGKTFFYRGNRWVDSSLTADQEKKVQQLERYGKEYFELVTRYGKHVAKYLAMEGPVTVVLDGQAYAF